MYKKSLFLIILSLVLISCGSLGNATEQHLVSDTIRVINEAKFIQQYMQFRSELIDKGNDVKRLLKEDKIKGSQYDELVNAYDNTRTQFNGIFKNMVTDLVVNIDKMIVNENHYRDKYTDSFKDGIERTKSTDQFLGLYAQYSDKDESVVGALVTILGPVVLDGIRGFVRNSKKFKSFSEKRLSAPVIDKFGFPSFEEL